MQDLQINIGIYRDDLLSTSSLTAARMFSSLGSRVSNCSNCWYVSR